MKLGWGLALFLLLTGTVAAQDGDERAPKRQESRPPEEEWIYEPWYRDSWVAFSLILPQHFDGKTFARENGVGSRQDFEHGLGIDVDIAFDLNIHYAVDEGFMIFNVAGVWWEGDTTTTGAIPYGGVNYPAGTEFHSEGRWLWYELGYGYQVGFDDVILVFGGFSLAADNVQFETLQQNPALQDQYMESITILVGARGGIVFRPFPFIAFGVEAGAWVGGLTYEMEEDVRYDLSSWSTLVHVWAGVDVHEFVSIRVGYYLRAFEVESDHRHPAAGGVGQRLEDDDVFLRYGGLMVSLVLHY